MVSQTLRVATNDIENQIDDLSLSTSNSDYDAAIIANECTPLVTPRIMTPSERRDSFRSIQSGIDAIYALPGMRIRSHCIGENGGLTPCTEEEALAGANQKQKNGNHKQQYYWMDIDADPTRDAEELRAWLRALHLPNFVIEALSEPPETWASQVMPLQRACLAVLRILPEHYDDQEQLMAHLAALSLRNMLITFSVNPRTVGNLYDPVRKRMQQAERLPSPTSQGAMISWLRFHLDRTSRATRELRYAVLTMDESMDRDIASVKLEELIAAKDRVLILLSVAEEQVECVESLLAATTAGTPTAASNTTSPSNASFVRNGEKLGNGLDFSPVQGSLASLVAAAGATERMALRLEKHIVDLRERAEQHEHTLMNRRLGVLTVLSAIFLPLTLLTGIWGMNFSSMPELQEPYSYPLALMFMLSLALFMIYYFRRGGWLD